jgi:hypothetical protein
MGSFVRGAWLAFTSIVLAASSESVSAWDGSVTAKVAAYEVVALENGGTNYDFRVHLEGVSLMCTGGAGSWAYINASAGNYKAVVAAVISAHSAGRQLTVYTNRAAQNYCQIGHIQVN